MFCALAKKNAITEVYLWQGGGGGAIKCQLISDQSWMILVKKFEFLAGVISERLLL